MTKLKRQIGRPKIDKPKSVHRNVRMTEAEWEKIEKIGGMTKFFYMAFNKIFRK